MQQSRMKDIAMSRSPVNHGVDYSSPDTTNGTSGSEVVAGDKPVATENESGKYGIAGGVT
jgi:hypothetical protein